MIIYAYNKDKRSGDMGNNEEIGAIGEIISGYAYEGQSNAYVCSECGARFEEGEIFVFGDRLFEAKRAVEIHVSEHGDRLECLLASGSKYLQLTDNQTGLLKMMRAGFGDSHIAAETGLSASTVRHNRFVFREKAKQARMYLAAYTLASEKTGNPSERLVPVREGAKMVDDRYIITEQEREKILLNAFESMEPLRLKIFPAKEKKKLAILIKIAEQFETGRIYSEKQVNAVLREIFDDYVTLRRYLIEYGFMERKDDGSEYKVKQK